jgi:hypothetical protein
MSTITPVVASAASTATTGRSDINIGILHDLTKARLHGQIMGARSAGHIGSYPEL